MHAGVTMELTEQDKAFLAKRRRLLRAWPVVGALLLATLLALAAWMLYQSPLLINPRELASRIESDNLPASTLAVMAGLLPFTVLTCFMMVAIVIVYGYGIAATERKYLSILQRAGLER
jgi:hypothetical protein